MSLTDDAVQSPSHPRHRPWQAAFTRLHFYAGILVGPFLLIAALTGGLYALAPTVERVVYGDVLTVDAVGGHLPLTDQVAAARQHHPGWTVSAVRPPAAADDATRVYFADPALDEESLRAVFVDPHTGRVLGDHATWLGYLPLSTWLDGLHRHLNLGEPGRIYSELAASWLWVVALGGTYLWWTRSAERRGGHVRRMLTVNRRTSGRSRTLNWHGATGAWLLAALLFLSATGITWSTYAGAHVSDIRSALNWQRPQLLTAVDADIHAGHAPGSAMAPGSPVDLEALLTVAARSGVEAPLEITLPSAPGQAATVTEIDAPYRWTTDAVAVDPASLAVTGRIDYWRDYSVVAKLADWGIRAHMGFLFGWLNQVLLAGVAVGLITVIVRGYRMWWQRRPTRASCWAVGRAPARGGWRRLHPAAGVAVVFVAAAVGWFLPLLGLSLAGFLVVDMIVGAVRARRGR